jgi:hypothetical protein
MGSSAVAFAVVLLPGIAAWWTGRRLIPLRDDPALPERLMARRTRLAQAAGICWAGQLFLPGGALWMLAPGLLALLTGSFASRRALFDESWGLPSYLAWVLRLGVASGGFWTLLAAAPSIVEWGGGSWPIMSALTQRPSRGPAPRLPASITRDRAAVAGSARSPCPPCEARPSS